MEAMAGGFASTSSTGAAAIHKKPRSAGSRKPRATETLTATPHIENTNSAAAEGYKRKELYLNGLPASKKSRREERGGGSGQSTENALTPANWKNVAADNNRLRKVKLKVGGVTRTIHDKTGCDGGEGNANKNKTKGEYWFSNTTKGDTPEKYNTGSSSSEPVRKSRRVPKRRSLDSDIDEDSETRYMHKIRVSKGNSSNNGNNNIRSHRVSNYEVDNDYVISRMGRDGNNNRKRHNKEVYQQSGGENIENEEMGSDNNGSDVKLTSRQRAMQGKSAPGDSLIEFPNGLPPAPSRKQKEKLSEVEIQAKKAEAAQRRKMQVEKAAREAEADAIRKILGLDSDKKKEEKKQKERDEKEKAAKLQISAANTIRWVMGPAGTVVTFPDEIGLPSILNSRPSSYPPPREKCAGPSCTNPYKYRDAKSNLPLCSLMCYKAIQGSANSSSNNNNVHTLTC